MFIVERITQWYEEFHLKNAVAEIEKGLYQKGVETSIHKVFQALSLPILSIKEEVQFLKKIHAIKKGIQENSGNTLKTTLQELKAISQHLKRKIIYEDAYCQLTARGELVIKDPACSPGDLKTIIETHKNTIRYCSKGFQNTRCIELLILRCPEFSLMDFKQPILHADVLFNVPFRE